VQLTEIIKRVQRIFGDEDEVQIQIQDIISWASDGQMEIARQTECLTKNKIWDWDPVSAYSFALPADFILEKRVTWTDGSVKDKPLGKTTLELIDQQGFNTSTRQDGTPSTYYIWSGLLNVLPLINAPHTQAVKLWYVCSPDPLVQIADQLQIPMHMHEDVVRYCLMRARELNEDVEQASRIEAGLGNRMMQSRSEAFNPYKDQYPVIRPDPGDWWN